MFMPGFMMCISNLVGVMFFKLWGEEKLSKHLKDHSGLSCLCVCTTFKTILTTQGDIK